MPYTEEMTTSEILLRLASMRNELLQAVNDIEKISKNICYKAEQTESSSEKPNSCDTCRFELYCPEMCEGCCEWDSHYEPKDEPTISKMEQVDKDINVRSKDEPQTCKTCKWGEWYRKGYDITMMDDECGGCCSWNSKWKPKDEPQTNADQHVQHVESVEQMERSE